MYRSNSDILNVNLSQDGRETWQIVSKKSGITLQTVSPSDPQFFPVTTSDWATKFVNLSAPYQLFDLMLLCKSR
jgi:hypothetical protein